jgi:hypothetical protein
VNDPQTLQALLDAAMARRQVTSGRQLADLAKANGYALSHATVNLIRSGSHQRRPSEGTVRAIGWLAGVSEREAFAAAGLPVPGPPFADELPPGVDSLSPKARRAVIELLRVLVDEERDGDAEHAAPTKTARSATAAGGPSKDEMGLAAMAGTPAYAERDATGEHSQDPGHDDPA